MNDRMRLQETALERKAIVKHCIHEFQRFIGVTDDLAGGSKNALERVIALRDGIERFALVGCEIEAQFVRNLAERLFQSASPCDNEELRKDVEDAATRLDRIPWLPNTLLARRPGSRQGPFRIYFIRHAESTGNQERRLQGSRIHGALTPRGLLQSTRTAEYLFETFEDLRTGNALLVSSPVGRALETARSISERLGCSLSTEADLAELDFGEWSGRSFADLECDRKYQEWIKDKWFRLPPSGESLFEVRTRMCQAVSLLVSRAVVDDIPLVIVTHFFPLIAVLDALIPGEPIRPDNSSVTCLEFEHRHWHPIVINHTLHLEGDAPTPVGYV